MAASFDHTVAFFNRAPTHLQITYCILVFLRDCAGASIDSLEVWGSGDCV